MNKRQAKIEALKCAAHAITSALDSGRAIQHLPDEDYVKVEYEMNEIIGSLNGRINKLNRTRHV